MAREKARRGINIHRLLTLVVHACTEPKHVDVVFAALHELLTRLIM